MAVELVRKVDRVLIGLTSRSVTARTWVLATWEVAKESGTRVLDSTLLNQPLISDIRRDFLFATLFLTSVGVFIGGNLLLPSVLVLQHSARIALACFATLLIFYVLSRLARSVPWGLVLTYLLMWIVVYSRQQWLTFAFWGLAVMALVHVLRFLRVERARWHLVVLMATLATVVILGVTTHAYTSFDMLNRLYAGNVHQDTLFHASIAAMLKNYGVASTGLYGLVETPYHVLSHMLFASISRLSGVSVFEVYGVASWILFAPILVFNVVVCSAALEKTGKLSTPVAWSLACLSLVVLPLLLRGWMLLDSFFVSESYLVSLGLFLLGIPLLFRRRLSPLDLMLVVILTALTTNAKASVGLIFAGLWFARVLFVRSEDIRLDAAACILSAGVATWVIFSLRGSVQSATIAPLSFIGDYSFLGEHLLDVKRAVQQGEEAISLRSALLALVAVLSFFICHFLLSWILIARAVYKNSIFFAFKDPLAVYSLAAVAAGALVVCLFSIPGGSAGYFTGVAFFVALPGVIVWVASMLSRRRLSSVPLFVVAILLIGLLNVRAFHRANTAQPSESVSLHSAFIDSLIDARNGAPVNVVLRPAAQLSAGNPVSRCTAQPFVYPAVSERPWIDVIPVRSDCTYENYGYARYGISESEQIVTVDARLLPDMTTCSWPHTPAELESSDDTSAK